MKFKTTILQGGKTATGIQVPDSVVEQLGAGKRPPVNVTINGYTYRSTVAVMGGKFMVGVSAEVRERAKVACGDKLPLPADFKQALDKNPKAKKVFEALSYSRKQRLVIPVEKGKTTETRRRNIAKALVALSSGE